MVFILQSWKELKCVFIATNYYLLNLQSMYQFLFFKVTLWQLRQRKQVPPALAASSGSK